ncbi:hypothetical protein [Streptomyces xiamenensis]|uniref:hypothetical protein n=1 Tax=Streptomyces xiamenensis TaxID=408015 RepID=UPI0035E087BE
MHHNDRTAPGEQQPALSETITTLAHRALAAAGIPSQALLLVSPLPGQIYQAHLDSGPAAHACETAWRKAGYRVRRARPNILAAALVATGQQQEDGRIRLCVEAPVQLPDGPDRPTRLTDAELLVLRERARREAGPFVDPAIVHRAGPTWHSRQWAEAVLGYPFEELNWPAMYLLHIAMQAEPVPPVTRAQAAAAAQHEAAGAACAADSEDRAERYAARDAADAQRWAELTAACPVAVEVRPNVKGAGRIRGGRNIGPLRHVTPLAEAVSARRRHRVGRALCEDTRERQLGDPVAGHATCTSCVAYMSLIRLAADH